MIEDEIERASKAKLVLDNPEFQRAFDQVRTAIHDVWESCPIRDTEGQHSLKLQLKLLGDVKANLERAIADGTMAALELERSRKPILGIFKRGTGTYF